jgi:diguanylate cyclase (GGDEF)-like protein/PAS domain S-box-containing protein
MRIRLSTRLILFVVILQAALLFLLLWNNARFMTMSHSELIEDTVQVESQLLLGALAPGLANNDIATLDDVLSLIQKEQHIVYAEVSNRQNEVLSRLGNPPAYAQPDLSYASARQDGIYDLDLNIALVGQDLGRLRVGYSLSKAMELSQQAKLQNSLIAFFGLAVTTFATLLLGAFLTRNLRKLEAGAQALSENKLDHRIEVSSLDEVGDLAQAFNQLAQHLHQTQCELQDEHRSLERETAFLHTLMDGINAVIMEARPPLYQFTYVSHQAEYLLGFSVEEWLEPDFFQRQVHPDDRGWLEQSIEKNTARRQSFSLDFRIKHKNGKVLWLRAINNVEIDERGQPTVRGLLLDITENKTAEDRIVYLAEHDPLTGLINRRRFQNELERALSYSQRYQQEGAILFIDLDQFKYVNDTYGHQYGDEYLLDISRRLSHVLRRSDILGRLGGDEFGVIIPRAKKEEAYTVGLALLGALTQENPDHDHHTAPASASIGIALFPSQGDTPSDLLAKADAAMYTAKHNGRGQVHVYHESDTALSSMQAKIHWEERIRWALKEDRFCLFFQPVVDMQSGLITHYETLLRMKGEDGKMIAPAAFLDTAERFGLIKDIDRWVVKDAIRFQGRTVADHKPISLAINLSGRHFGSKDMLQVVQESIEQYGADPGSLMFEVTETEAVQNLTEAQSFINALRKLGCRFALDDFGIGFSSFQYLRNLAVDFVKIDGSFVRNLHVDKDDRVFVKAIVDLAHGLGISCIAEFVENEHIVDILLGLGVSLGQGYHLARPEPHILDSHFLKPDRPTSADNP